MLSVANAFEISDIERVNIGARQPAAQDITMIHALWLPKITIRQPQEQPGTVTGVRVESNGDDFVSIRWDDGGRDLPLTPAKGFTLILRRAWPH